MSLIEVLVTGVLLFIGFLAYVAMERTASVQRRAQFETTYAMAQIGELIEFFRSLTQAQLNAYVSVNPLDLAGTPYRLCDNVNLLDRTATGAPASPFIPLPDPIASFAKMSDLDRGEDTLAANRFYRVTVINLQTLVPQTAACGTTGPYNFAANPTHRFMVEVGVNWIPLGEIEPKQVALATLIPE